MKITNIRISKAKPTSVQLVSIVVELRKRFAKAGFETGVEQLTSTSISIGLHMRSFQLDLSKHDRNLYRSRCGDKLTNLPTWDQRVEFNDIVNAVLSKAKASATVRSGPFTIRKGFHEYTESDWHNQTPHWVEHNVESVDEKQYIEERRERRNREARAKRRESATPVHTSNRKPEPEYDAEPEYEPQQRPTLSIEHWVDDGLPPRKGCAKLTLV